MDVPEDTYLEALRQVDVLRRTLERIGAWLDAGADPQYVNGAKHVIKRAFEEAGV